MMLEIKELPGGMPNIDTVILPGRAFLLSCQAQTLPARRASLEDSCAEYQSLKAGEAGLRDMAVLAVVADAMQCLEDLAYLATAWDKPFTGLATYIRAITYAANTPTNFWQEVPKWNPDRIDVFAGLSGKEPGTEKVVDIFREPELLTVPSEELIAVMEAARLATRERLRRLLVGLAKDWKQFSQYFLAFKHGGLAINREDMAFVDDAETSITESTPRLDPSIAVWSRRPKDDAPQADSVMTRDQLVEYASSGGHLARRMCERFIETRLSVIRTLEWGANDTVIGLHPLSLPWTLWLREEDLTEEQWRVIGPGPQIGFSEADANS